MTHHIYPQMSKLVCTHCNQTVLVDSMFNGSKIYLLAAFEKISDKGKNQLFGLGKRKEYMKNAMLILVLEF